MASEIPSLDSSFYLAASPVLVLAVGSLVVLLVGLSSRSRTSALTYGLTMTFLLGSFSCGMMLIQDPVSQSFLQGTLLAENLGFMGQLLVLAIALVVTVLFWETSLRYRFFRGEICSLFLLVILGMLVLVASDDLVTVFVGLELSSIGLYALIGYIWPDRKSQEGAVKYFVLGSFAAAFLLMGFALFYAAAGSMEIHKIAMLLSSQQPSPFIPMALIFVVAGLGFKLALVPFHQWAPDAYESAPTGMTALMATAVKVMIIVLTLRFFSAGMSSQFEVWISLMTFVASLSMIFGNVLALVQTSIKRMLAYSSIAHSGYLAVALAALGGYADPMPIDAVLFYLLSYCVVSLGVFSILMWLENQQIQNLQLNNLSGLARAHPYASAALALFMFALAGMPPTAGFLGKFYVFGAALKGELYGLAVVGVIGSAISFYYYLRVIVRLYMVEPDLSVPELTPSRSRTVAALVGLFAAASLALGTFAASPAMKAISLVSQQMVGR